MIVRGWRSATLLALVFGLLSTTTALARSTPPIGRPAGHGGPLSGYWSGYLARQTAHGVRREHIAIHIDARERGGSWKLSARCYGSLKLDSISGGYHHYLRIRARGKRVHLSAHCTGGDVDCLKRAGAGLYDAVTSHLGGAWDSGGTLKRARRH